MNVKFSVRTALPRLRISLAVCCFITGCATRLPNAASSDCLGGFAVSYQGFTNRMASPLPKPTGPYAVGRVDRLLTDSSRNILYRSVTNGSLMTTIWFPAGEVGKRIPGPYVNPREMQSWIDLFGKYGFHWDTAQIARLTNSSSYSFPDAPLSSHPRKFPVVLYVHGHVGLRTDNTGSAEELASHGFIVVSSAHGDTAGMEMPDRTLVETKPEFHLSGNDTNPIAVAVFQDRTRDLRFVIDQFERLNANDQVFAGRFNMDCIGVFGWSYGGAVAAELCRVEPRCKAGVALDPGGHPDLSQVRFKQPFMILTGPNGVTWGARQLFEQLNGDAWFIKIRDASHDEFGDNAEFFRSAKTGRTQALVRTYLVSFFTRYLQHQDEYDLESLSPSRPEIEEFMKK